MNYPIKFLTLGTHAILTLLFISSCSLPNNSLQTSSQANTINEPVSLVNDDAKTNVELEFGGFVEPPNGMTKEEFNKQILEILVSPDSKTFKQVRSKISSNSKDWDNTDKLLREYLQSSQNTVFAWYFHQLVAATVLDRFLINMPVTPKVQKDIEFYLNVLLRYNNYNEIVTVSKALPMLVGYWSDAQIRSVSSAHYQKFGSNISPASYVRRNIAARAEGVAKSAPNQYPDTESVSVLTKNIYANLWQERILAVSKRSKQIPFHSFSNFNELAFAVNEGRLIVAMLADDSSENLLNIEKK